MIRLAIGSLMAWLLTGMDGGCVYSQHPAGSSDDRIVDHYLPGEWHAAEIGDQGEFVPGALAVEIRTGANGDLQVRQFVDDEVWIYTAYATRLAGRKYLNLRITGCENCEASAESPPAEANCPYIIVQYRTYVDREMALATETSEAGVADLLRHAEDVRGKLIVYGMPDSDAVEGAAEEGLVELTDDCENCDSSDICLGGSASGLNDFLSAHAGAVFPLGDWEALIRSDR